MRAAQLQARLFQRFFQEQESMLARDSLKSYKQGSFSKIYCLHTAIFKTAALGGGQRKYTCITVLLMSRCAEVISVPKWQFCLLLATYFLEGGFPVSCRQIGPRYAAHPPPYQHPYERPPPPYHQSRWK